MAKRSLKNQLNGVAVLMVTALNKDHTLNEKANRAEIDWVIERGATGLWPSGHAGEWMHLDEDVRKKLFEIYADHAKGRAHIAAGCHACKTSEAIRLVNHADKVGCDFAWICPPGPEACSEQDLYLHYQTIIDNTSLPLALYNSVPTGTYMPPEVVINIINLKPERFVAAKDSVGDFCHQTELFRLGIAKKVAYFAVTRVMIPSLYMGGQGVLSNPWAVPQALACYNAFKAGDFKKAWDLQIRIIGQRPLLDLPWVARKLPGAPLAATGMGIHKYKVSVLTGIEMGPPAPPLSPVTPTQIKAVQKEIEIWKPLDPKAWDEMPQILTIEQHE